MDEGLEIFFVGGGEKVKKTMKKTMTQCRRIGRTPCALIGVLFISL